MQRTTWGVCLAVVITVLTGVCVEKGYAQETFLECLSPQDDDDNGAPLTQACQLIPTELWHDADDHDFCLEIIPAGCDIATECLGRCGAGCGSTGSGIYSLDCAEHDRCCRAHGGCFNPLDSECGDEYREAASDFLFGSPNCTEGCLPQAATTCHTIESPDLPPEGLGAPYSTQTSEHELLIQAECENNQAAVTLGNRESSLLTYVWPTLYYWLDDGRHTAQLLCSEPAGQWCKNSGQTTIDLNPQTTWVIGYICQWDGSRWYCGCRDNACTQSFWQAQQIQR